MSRPSIATAPGLSTLDSGAIVTTIALVTTSEIGRRPCALPVATVAAAAARRISNVLRGIIGSQILSARSPCLGGYGEHGDSQTEKRS
jgi:hypothetical protein